MKQAINHKGWGTFVAIYTSYYQICNQDKDAAILLRVLEQKTGSGETSVSWTHNEVIKFSRGLLTKYAIRSASKVLCDLKLISINAKPGVPPEYTFNAVEINRLIDKEHGNIDQCEVEQAQDSVVQCEIEQVHVRYGTGTNTKENDYPCDMERVPVLNGTGTEPENSLEDTENKGTYEEISECPKNNKNVVRMSVRENQEENTYNGSVCTTPLTAVATAPLTSVAYAPSLAIEKENFQESAIETTSAIITTSASHPGHEVGKMNTTDVLTQIFIKYAKVPEKKRDAKCKGSASRLMQNWGDRIKSVVDEVGEEALVAMDNFIRDEYWLAKGLPLPAFKSQFRKYLSSEEPESEEQSEIQTSAKPARKSQASSGSSYQPSQFAYTDHHPIAVFSLQDQSGAILRKREALDILQQVGGDLEAEGRAEIGFKIDPSMYSAVEEWHSKALQAYKSIKNRDYPVLTEPIKGVLNA